MTPGDESGAGPRPTPPLSAVGPDVALTATLPPATPTPQPNRRDCAAIRDTPYLSDEEGAWYRQNCASNDAPPVPAGTSGAQVSIGDRLIIPGASVNAEVYRATVPGSGQMPDPVGYFNAVWYDFGSWPGMGGYVNAGNMVLSGHVDCGRCYNGGSGTAIFWSVRQLKAGDTAEYRTADGRSFTYIVTDSRAVLPTADFAAIVASSAADMTLITCTGTFSGGEYNQRHVVTFRKV
jgi:LPXTG-site transpeptidase (sortase) family protein